MTALTTLKTGTQEIRLATSMDEVHAAQALRYRVFYDEMGAQPDEAMRETRRDFDPLDDTCDHLLVVDKGQVVGTYRIMRRCHAARAGHFYSSTEYDIDAITSFDGEIMELGRSCVDAAYRDRYTMQLLWRGLAEYVEKHGVDLMFGCASLPGTDPANIGAELTYLYYHHMAPPELRARALDHLYTDMRRVPVDTIDPKRTLASLPPLLKGYLRVGGFIGDGAVVDHQFNTTDVCIVVKTDLISERYSKHYDLNARTSSAN